MKIKDFCPRCGSDRIGIKLSQTVEMVSFTSNSFVNHDMQEIEIINLECKKCRYVWEQPDELEN